MQTRGQLIECYQLSLILRGVIWNCFVADGCSLPRASQPVVNLINCSPQGLGQCIPLTPAWWLTRKICHFPLDFNCQECKVLVLVCYIQSDLEVESCVHSGKKYGRMDFSFLTNPVAVSLAIAIRSNGSSHDWDCDENPIILHVRCLFSKDFSFPAFEKKYPFISTIKWTLNI